MKDWKAAIRTWEKNSNSKQEVSPVWLNQDLGKGGFIDDEEGF